MKLEFKIKKSAGVQVTPAVWRRIAQGNEARDSGNWQAAAQKYAEALALDSSLHHIHVQHGHVLKEAGSVEEAHAAYMRAVELRPNVGEPLLHFGHWFKQRGDRASAARNFLAAIRCDDVTDNAAADLAELIQPVAALSPAMLVRVAKAPDVSDVPTSASGQSGDKKLDHPFVFDLTDLVTHFRRQRALTDIQRVQVEVICSVIRTYGTHNIQLCSCIEGRDYWVGVTADLFGQLISLASTEGDSEAWELARTRLFLGLISDPYFQMPGGAILMDLGAAGTIDNRFDAIRSAKEKSAVHYIPFVYDMAPLTEPQRYSRDIVDRHTAWAANVVRDADFFLVGSLSTKNNLLGIAGQLGHSVAADRVQQVPLNVDSRRAGGALARSELRRWGLQYEPYALFISSTESRENPALVFETWSRLIRKYGADKVPRLVCVGYQGQVAAQVLAGLAANPDLRERIVIIDRIADAELALLYRECSFTLHPSHYEGWELPVTESLCYGRIPVVAGHASRSGAGTDFAVTFDDRSRDAMLNAVALVAFDEDWKTCREVEIAQCFRPRTWSQVAEQIVETAERLVVSTESGPAVAKSAA